MNNILTSAPSFMHAQAQQQQMAAIAAFQTVAAAAPKQHLPACSSKNSGYNIIRFRCFRCHSSSSSSKISMRISISKQSIRLL